MKEGDTLQKTLQITANQDTDKDSKIKYLHQDDEDNIIHHHLKEPLRADSVKEYDQIILHDEYDTEHRNSDQYAKDFKSGKKKKMTKNF